MYGQNVPAPIAIHCTKWYNNSLSLGSFHSISAGFTYADFTNLPLGVNNLLFAGTVHVQIYPYSVLVELFKILVLCVSYYQMLYFAGDGSDAQYLGLVQGAYTTGVNKANTVINALASSTSSSSSALQSTRSLSSRSSTTSSTTSTTTSTTTSSSNVLKPSTTSSSCTSCTSLILGFVTITKSLCTLHDYLL